MTQKIIQDHWMTIGTDNKAGNVFTKSGKVRSGAKGIGRFALDKLGDIAQLYTVFDRSTEAIKREPSRDDEAHNGYYWSVNWSDFEQEEVQPGEKKTKTLDEVNALLEPYSAKLMESISEIDDEKFVKLLESYNRTTGTIIKISNLRDVWSTALVDQIYDDLELLVPPQESSSFDIHLFSSLDKDKFGKVENSPCDDYDYKLVAEASANQNVNIKVFRNEYDVASIDCLLYTSPSPRD